MKSTRFQQLKGDYDFVCRQLKEYHKVINDLREENENLKWELNIYKKLKTLTEI